MHFVKITSTEWLDLDGIVSIEKEFDNRITIRYKYVDKAQSFYYTNATERDEKFDNIIYKIHNWQFEL